MSSAIVAAVVRHVISKTVACQLSSVLIKWCAENVDGFPKFFHENCVVIVSAGFTLS